MDPHGSNSSLSSPAHFFIKKKMAFAALYWAPRNSQRWLSVNLICIADTWNVLEFPVFGCQVNRTVPSWQIMRLQGELKQLYWEQFFFFLIALFGLITSNMCNQGSSCRVVPAVTSPVCNDEQRTKHVNK